MKLIYMVVLFSSMLFGMQKQIILGSYTLESNGLNAVKHVEKQIANDEKLKSIMEKSSANVMATRVSSYTVVSINAFETYSDLVPAMEVFKTYYKDAFSLNYPTKGFLEKESFQVVVKKAKKEQGTAKEIPTTTKVAKVTKAKEVKVTHTSNPEEKELGIVEKILLAQAAMLEKERLDEAKEEVIVEKKSYSAPVNETSYADEELNEESNKKPMERTYTVVDNGDGLSQLDYNILIGLIILVMMIGGFIIFYKIKKDEEK